MRTLIAMLCVAIGFVLVTDPRSSQTTAHDGAANPVVESLNQLNESLGVVSDILANHSKELAAIEKCQADDSAEIKSRLVAIESAPKASSDGCECGECNCDERLKKIEAEVAALKAMPVSSGGYPAVSSSSGYGSTGTPVVMSGGSTGTPVVSYGGSTGNVVSSARGETGASAQRLMGPTPVRNVVSKVVDATPRWQNHDGLSRRQHLEQVHGMSTAGMSESELIAAQNHYHDTYGGGHPVKMPSAPVRSTASNNNCPGGVCPTPQSSARVSSDSGWWLGKNLGVRR
jgi:hypothetical protein